MLTFNGSSSALVIAIDLGYNYIDGALASLDGKKSIGFNLLIPMLTKMSKI